MCNGTTEVYDHTQYNASHLQGKLSWSPSNAFFLGFCHFGQLTNHLQCWRNAFLIAGLLNRTLLIHNDPNETHYKIDISPSIDFDHIKSCFGPTAVMTTEDYRKKFRKDPEIDEIICWMNFCHNIKQSGSKRLVYSSWKSISLAPHVKRSRPRLHSPPVSQKQLIEEFGRANGTVLTVGELYYVNVKEYSGKYKFYLPFKRSEICPYPLDILPSRPIMDAARAFVEEVFEGSRFLGVHWRRGDFASFCRGTRKNGCFRKVRDVAYCITEKASRNQLTKIYVATNENKRKMMELKKLLSLMEPKLSLFFYQNSEGSSVADFLRRRNVPPFSRFHVIPFEKAICALSTVYLSTPFSSFSKDIERLRYGLKTASCHDTFICEDVSFWE